MRNCTISDNVGRGTVSAGGIYILDLLPGAQVNVSNCIVFGNSGAQIGGTGVATVSHSCIQGGFVGNGNISSDPLFEDAAGGDFHLHKRSPCRDVGDRSLLPSDAFDLDDDSNTVESLSRDLDLNRRIVNGLVDMGAFEWQSACLPDISPSSPGFAGDGEVNVNDLLAIINSWGSCDQCVADVNGDDAVNVNDLLEVINGWGLCPR